MDVDTSAGQFSGVPIYVTSLAGRSHHWATTGASSVYNPTATGFRIYIRWADGKPMTADVPAAYGWHVNWLGVDQAD